MFVAVVIEVSLNLMDKTDALHSSISLNIRFGQDFFLHWLVPELVIYKLETLPEILVASIKYQSLRSKY